MRSKGFHLFIACLLLIALASTELVAQNLKASQGITGRNIIPRFAINSSNGDIFVVWTQQIPNTLNLRTWGRLIKRKNTGNYKMKKAVMLSPANGYHANANVAYLPGTNEYLVVWDTFNFNEGLKAASIIGRIVNKRGKAKQSMFTILSDGLANNWPQVAVIPGQTNGVSTALDEDDKVFLIWTGFPVDPNDKDAGLKVAELRQDFREFEEAEVVVQVTLPPDVLNPKINDVSSRPFAASAQTGVCLNSGGIRINVDWSNTVFDNNGVPTSQESGYFWFFNENDVETVINVLDGAAGDPSSRFWIFAAATTNVEFQLTVADTETGGLNVYQTDCPFERNNPPRPPIVQSFDSPPLEPFQPILDTQAFNTTFQAPHETAPSAKEKIGRILVNRASGLFGIDIQLQNGNKVKLSKKLKRIFAHTNNLAWLEADVYSATNTSIIVWQKNISTTNQEIWLNIN